MRSRLRNARPIPSPPPFFPFLSRPQGHRQVCVGGLPDRPSFSSLSFVAQLIVQCPMSPVSHRDSGSASYLDGKYKESFRWNLSSPSSSPPGAAWVSFYSFSSLLFSCSPFHLSLLILIFPAPLIKEVIARASLDLAATDIEGLIILSIFHHPSPISIHTHTYGLPSGPFIYVVYCSKGMYIIYDNNENHLVPIAPSS